MSTAWFDRSFFTLDARHRRTGLIARTVAILLVGLFAQFVVFIPLADRLTTEYDSTPAVVSDNGTRMQTKKTGRRSFGQVEMRAYELTYERGGDTHRDIVFRPMDEPLTDGETVQVWVADNGSSALLEEPARPGFWAWTWATVMALLLLWMLWRLGVAARRMRVMARVSAEWDTASVDSLLFRVDRASWDEVPRVSTSSRSSSRRFRTVVTVTVIRSDIAAIAEGTQLRLMPFGTRTAPEPQAISGQLQADVLWRGTFETAVALHQLGTSVRWPARLDWMTETTATSGAQAAPSRGQHP
ncbi:MAG: hypothetical protein ACTJHU_01905 [Mycetocola sp.]